MPVCLKCGKEIDKGKSYCDDCGQRGEAQVQQLLSLMESSRYRPSRRPRFRGIAIGLIALLLVVLIVTVALIIAIPSGPEFDSRLQAAGCRANMKRIERAVNSFQEVRKGYPPTGRVDTHHPLVVDEYLHKVWTCPSTHHYYLLSRTGSSVSVSCDSGLEGHKI